MYGVPDQTYEALAIGVISVFGMSSICGCNLSMKADSFQQASLRQDAECIEALNVSKLLMPSVVEKEGWLHLA